MAKIKINIYNTNTNVLNELIKQGAVETTENFEEVEVDEDTYNEVMSEQENESENKQEQKVKSKTSTQKNQQEEKPKEEMKTETNLYIKPKCYEHVKNLLKANLIPLLVGQAGVGKTEMAINLAKVLGLNFYSEAQIVDPFTIKGYMDANGKYVPSNFFKAYTEGGLFLLDEMDASDPNALVAMNQAMANSCYSFPHGLFNKHKDFRCIATANTFGDGASMEYVGRNQLDAATLNRLWTVVVEPDSKVENKLSKDKELIAFIQDVRKVCNHLQNHVIISYRSIQALNKMNELEPDNLNVNIKECLFPNLSKQDIAQIFNNCCFEDNKYYQALKKLGGYAN